VSKDTFIIVGGAWQARRPRKRCAPRASTDASCSIGSEAERPYERPSLTKDYLRGESEREKTYVHGRAFYEQHQIELETGLTVTAIDRDASRISVQRRTRADLRSAAASHRRRAAPTVCSRRRARRCLLSTHAGGLRRRCAGALKQPARRRRRRRVDRQRVRCLRAHAGLEVTLIDPLALPTSGSRDQDRRFLPRRPRSATGSN